MTFLAYSSLVKSIALETRLNVVFRKKRKYLYAQLAILFPLASGCIDYLL